MTTTTTPTTSTPPDLGSTQVQDGMNQSVSAAYLLQAYTQTVLQTPDITLPSVVDQDSNSNVVEQLPLDQATARTNASYYLATVNPAIIQTTSEIIGYGNKFISYYPNLMKQAANLTTGNNAQQFTEGINNLLGKAQSCETQAESVATLLTNFSALITTDSANFATDSSNVALALAGEDGEIQNLQNQLDAYNKAMNKDLGIMAAGGVIDAIGVTFILVGILGTFESGGTTIALVVTGIGCLAAGSTMGGMAYADYEDQCKSYQSTLLELNTDKQVYAATQQAATTIDSLLSAVQGGIKAVGSLQNSWAALIGDLQQVVDAVTDATEDTGVWIADDLTAAYNDWVACVLVATSIQENGTLPVQQQTVTQ